MNHGAVMPNGDTMSEAVLTLDALTAWGEAFGARLQPPAIITLAGDLGAGKTTLAQAICRGYGVQESVTSPTYALVHEYAAPRSPVYHLDLYRLAGPNQLANIGWEEILAAHALILIEWPERAGHELPASATAIRLSYVTDVTDASDHRRLVW